MQLHCEEPGAIERREIAFPRHHTHFAPRERRAEQRGECGARQRAEAHGNDDRRGRPDHDRDDQRDRRGPADDRRERVLAVFAIAFEVAQVVDVHDVRGEQTDRQRDRRGSRAGSARREVMRAEHHRRTEEREYGDHAEGAIRQPDRRRRIAPARRDASDPDPEEPRIGEQRGGDAAGGRDREREHRGATHGHRGQHALPYRCARPRSIESFRGRGYAACAFRGRGAIGIVRSRGATGLVVERDVREIGARLRRHRGEPREQDHRAPVTFPHRDGRAGPHRDGRDGERLDPRRLQPEPQRCERAQVASCARAHRRYCGAYSANAGISSLTHDHCAREPWKMRACGLIGASTSSEPAGMITMSLPAA